MEKNLPFHQLSSWSQITRKSTLHKGCIGHFELTRGIYSTHDYEFAEMAYSGTLNLFYQRGDPNTNYYEETQRHIRANEGWKNNVLFANDDTNHQAADIEFYDLLIDKDRLDKYIQHSHPSLMALLFPWILPNATGHYSVMPMNTPEAQNRNGIYALSENHDDIAESTLNSETLARFFKGRLMMNDRRFSKDSLLLFYVLDSVEKKNIATANRFIVSTKGRSTLK